MSIPLLAVLITVGLALAGGVWALVLLSFKFGGAFAELRINLKHAIDKLTAREKRDEKDEEHREKLVDRVGALETEHAETRTKIDTHLDAHP